MSRPRLRLSPGRLDAVVFDLDGVLTDTARLHEAAWKETFDAFLSRRSTPFAAFTHADYLDRVDGRTRQDGVRAFLAARRIDLPEGTATDASDAETVEGLSRRKNERVGERLGRDSTPLPGAEALLAALRDAGVRVGVASSSANAALVLEATGLHRFVEVRVDGVDIAALGLPGKPDPAMYREALARLGVGPDRAAVVEDAIAGVEAGRRAGVFLVVGVGRGSHAESLRRAGANAVVRDLAEVVVDGV